MISVNYKNEIKVETGDLTKSFKSHQLPLIVEFKKTISDETIWKVELNNNMWGTFPQVELIDVLINDNQNNFIYRYCWNVLQNGTTFHKSLWFYCQNLINQGKTPKGLAIGTHDGEFGEWVPLVKNGMSKIVLVEASKPQYIKLVKNFEKFENLEFVNEIITTDGNEVTFFEGGRGYTNSIVERVIRSWEKEEIHSTLRESININDLIKQKCSDGLDWLHLDVEGLDAKLIMSIDNDYLPDFIIFEHENLEFGEQDKVNNWLKYRKYDIYSEGGISMASRVSI